MKFGLEHVFTFYRHRPECYFFVFDRFLSFSGKDYLYQTAAVYGCAQHLKYLFHGNRLPFVLNLYIITEDGPVEANKGH